jgi:hypothetical protein
VAVPRPKLLILWITACFLWITGAYCGETAQVFGFVTPIYGRLSKTNPKSGLMFFPLVGFEMASFFPNSYPQTKKCSCVKNRLDVAILATPCPPVGFVAGYPHIHSPYYYY